MPKKVDHTERRHAIAQAVWRVTIADGLDTATLRRVADEAGVSMGRIQHYFPTKDAMLLHALTTMTDQVGHRIGTAISTADGTRDQVRALLSATLPLDDERRTEALVACAYLVRAAVDPATADHLRDGYTQGHAHLTAMLDAHGTADPATAATLLMSVTDGLTLHTLAGHHSPQTAIAALDAQLDRVFT